MEGCFAPYADIHWKVCPLTMVNVHVALTDPLSMSLCDFPDSISLTLLFTVSFKIDGKLGRIIIFLIILLLSLVVSFIFSLIPRATLQTLSNRISFFLAASTGAWLVFGTGLDVFVKSGLLDAPTLLVSQKGVFDQGPMENEEMERQRDNVVNWNVGKCKGLIAAIWLV